MKDFAIVKDGDGKERSFYFRFGSCKDFNAALAAVKSIHFTKRTYDPTKDNLWIVEASEEAEKALTEAFDNFNSCLLTARAQLTMF